MQDLNQVLWNRISGRLNARWQTDWAIEDQAKKLNSTARPYDQRAFSPLDPTAIWLSHLALAIYMFVVVNFDVLAQASDFQIETRQVVYLCWMQDLNQGLWNRITSRPNARWQTDWAIVVTIIATLSWASCGHGTGLQAHPLKSQYRFGKKKFAAELHKSYKKHPWQTSPTFSGHFTLQAEPKIDWNNYISSASFHGSQGNYASGNLNIFLINPYLFCVLWRCLCQENHFI